MNDKKKNKKKRGGLPTQMNLVIHIAAGAYLIYLAYSIYGDAGALTGSEKILFHIAVILFGVVGAVIVFSALRSLAKGEYEGGSGDPGKDNSKNEEEDRETAERKRIRFDESEEEFEENVEDK